MKCPTCQGGNLKEEPGACPLRACICDKCFCGFVLRGDSLDPDDQTTQAMKEMRESIGDEELQRQIDKWPVFEKE